MAKILDEYNVEGKIHTLDIISKSKRMFWNCISNSEGPKTRKGIIWVGKVGIQHRSIS